EAAHKFRDLILVWPRMLSLGPPPPPLTPPPCRERGTRTRARCWYAGFWLPSLVGGRCARRRRSQASECASSARSAGVPTGGAGGEGLGQQPHHKRYHISRDSSGLPACQRPRSTGQISRETWGARAISALPWNA